jgi:hypothetical protein
MPEAILSILTNSSQLTSDSLSLVQVTDNIESSSDIDPIIQPHTTESTTSATDQNHHPTESTTSVTDQNPPELIQSSTQPTRKSTRVSVKPKHLADFLCNLSYSSPDPSSTGIPYPITDYHSYANVSKSLSDFSQAIVTDTEPRSYKEASQVQCWVQAMQSEINALNHNKTWILVDKAPHMKPIGNKWVYKIKHKADGSVERYKARLVAKGYNQVEGLDFFDTFSPVAKITTVRTLIALASINSWHLHQMDVNNAFLHGDLQEEVYMDVPQGVTCSKPNQVCKLIKSLYGLRQASRKWYEKLTSLLIDQGYSQSSSDYSLFILRHGSEFTALLVYVDDIILA